MTAQDDWPELAKLVFWDRAVTLSNWQAGILAGQRAYLPQSVKHMSPEQFIRALGLAPFKTHWPQVRQALLPSERVGAAMLDRLWSHLVSGTWNVKQLLDLDQLARRR